MAEPVDKRMKRSPPPPPPPPPSLSHSFVCLVLSFFFNYRHIRSLISVANFFRWMLYNRFQIKSWKNLLLFLPRFNKRKARDFSILPLKARRRSIRLDTTDGRWSDALGVPQSATRCVITLAWLTYPLPKAIARECLLAALPLIADAITAEQTGRVEEATAALTLTAES